MSFGVLVTGPPGSGKSTYCAASASLLSAHQLRPAAVINLDFANDRLPYACAVDVAELVSLADVMASLGLGPNGGLVYCLEYLEANADWLVARLRPLLDEGRYLIFDTPGQAELYTFHEGLSRVLVRLQKELRLRLCALHLVDSHLCADPFTFVAATLLSLQGMVRLELPHINVLTKCDMRAAADSEPGIGLERFTDMMDLSSLLPPLDEEALHAGSAEGGASFDADAAADGSGAAEGKVRPRFPPRTIEFMRKFHRLHTRIVEVVTDFNLVSFVPVSVKDPRSLVELQARADHAIGFVATRSAAATALRAKAAAGSASGAGAPLGDADGEEEEEEKGR